MSLPGIPFLLQLPELKLPLQLLEADLLHLEVVLRLEAMVLHLLLLPLSLLR
jgi:hypothetical protein